MCALVCCGGTRAIRQGCGGGVWSTRGYRMLSVCSRIATSPCPLGSFALCYGTGKCPVPLHPPSTSPLLPQRQRLVPGQLLKTKGEEMDRIMSNRWLQWNHLHIWIDATETWAAPDRSSLVLAAVTSFC